MSWYLRCFKHHVLVSRGVAHLQETMPNHLKGSVTSIYIDSRRIPNSKTVASLTFSANTLKSMKGRFTLIALYLNIRTQYIVDIPGWRF